MDKPWLKRHTKALDRIRDEELAQWHFDPMRKVTDYIVVGNIKSAVGPEWDRIVRFAYDMDLTIEKSSIFDFSRSEDEAEDIEIIHNTGMIELMGYDKSSASQFKTYSDIYPDLFYPILREFALDGPTGSIIHQKPGWVCPWHYDMFNFYVRKNHVSDPKLVRRYLIFMEDWIWGHYFLVGNSVVHQWRAGDVITWPHRMRHVSANVGLTPKLTLQVTGVYREDSDVLIRSASLAGCPASLDPADRDESPSR